MTARRFVVGLVATLVVAVPTAACSAWVSLGDLPLDVRADGAPGGDGATEREASTDAAVDAQKPSYAPCKGKICGATCSVCDPTDPSCFETAEVKACDVNGLCRSGVPICTDASTPPYDPCEGKTCGSSCSECPPSDPTCVETAVLKFCNKARRCQASAPDC